IQRHRAVEEDGNIRNALVPDELAEVKQEVLSPVDGECRDDDFPATLDGLVDNLCKAIIDSLWRFLRAIAIGGFHDDVLAPGQFRRIMHERRVILSDVTGKDDSPGFTAQGDRD